MNISVYLFLQNAYFCLFISSKCIFLFIYFIKMHISVHTRHEVTFAFCLGRCSLRYPEPTPKLCLLRSKSGHPPTPRGKKGFCAPLCRPLHDLIRNVSAFISRHLFIIYQKCVSASFCTLNFVFTL